MTSKSYPTRTTLWDNAPAGDPGVPQPPTATVSRGAWRAPSAVLTDRDPLRVISAIPPVSVNEDESGPFPRRTRFATARSPWWRPRSNFGRILLGTATFLTLAALAAGLYVTRQFLIRDPHFRIGGVVNVESSGLSEVKRAELLPVFGEDIGRNIFFVPLSDRRKQLEQIPWVQQATVMRFLPDRLSVSIVERTPVAFVRQGEQVELADADGVILSMPPAMMAQHHYSFPVVIGIDAKDSIAGRRARMAVYQRFLAELDQNNRHLTDQISEIDLSDPEDLRATMPEQGSDILAHFGEDHFLDRLEIYKSHIAEWRQRYPALKGVDLRYNGEVPLEMETTAETAGASPTDTTATPIPSLPTAKSAVSAPRQEPLAVEQAKSPSTKLSHPSTSAKAASADTKKRLAQLKAAKARAAHEKAALHRTRTIAHPTSAAVKQAQPAT